ncbi:MAG: hypothetical protein JWQ09_5538 [Segetibacter sp.]|nr:hypothetical protein [Segetibacter sp.]
MHLEKLENEKIQGEMTNNGELIPNNVGNSFNRQSLGDSDFLTTTSND